jgi:hypothetical protein
MQTLEWQMLYLSGDFVRSSQTILEEYNDAKALLQKLIQMQWYGIDLPNDISSQTLRKNFFNRLMKTYKTTINFSS